MLDAFAGFRAFLEGGSPKISQDDDIVSAVGHELPHLIVVTVHKAVDLWHPTRTSRLKFSPYVAAYMLGKKNERQKTNAPVFGKNENHYEHTMTFPYLGEPLLIVQAFDQDIIKDQFIGETPLDILTIINTHSREWVGPVTIYGQKGSVERGQIWLTIKMVGGTPYVPDVPCLHYKDTGNF